MHSADPQFFDLPMVTHIVKLPVHHRFGSAPGDGFERCDWQQRPFRLTSILPSRYDGRRDGMLGMCVHAGGKLQQPVRRQLNQRNHIGHDGPTVRERAGLVQRHRLDQTAILQMHAALDQNALSCRSGKTADHGNRRGDHRTRRDRRSPA